MKIVSCKVVSLLLALAMMLSMLPLSKLPVFAAEYAIDSSVADSGNGTKNDPYLISNATQLRNVSKNLTSSFKITADITVDSDLPIGDSHNPFWGTIDGNGKTITVTINSSAENVGLFGYNCGFIKDLKISGSVKNSDSISTVTKVGSLVGFNVGNLSNCSAICTVEDNEKDSGTQQTIVGGLVGENYGAIKSCDANGNVAVNVTGSNIFNYVYVGGLVGQNKFGSITNCYATGNVTGFEAGSDSEGLVGGLIGESEGYAVTNCYATGDVTGKIDTFCTIGGLIGLNFNPVSGCHTTGKVIGSTTTTSCITQSCSVGGLLGTNELNSPVTNSFASGDVLGSGSLSSYVGGLIGDNFSTVTNGYAVGNVSGIAGAVTITGGLVGVNSNIVTNCYAVGNVSGIELDNGLFSHLGGLLGLNQCDTSSIKDCYYNDSAKQTLNDIIQNNSSIGSGLGDVTPKTSSYMKSSDFITDLNSSDSMDGTEYHWESDSSNTNNGYPVMSI